MSADGRASVARDARPAPRRLRSILGGSAGNLVEWYDWYTYSACSLYFAAAVFPPADRNAQLLNAAAVFAVGFFARPLGGWWFGRYADRRGRRSALTRSVLLMGAGSLLVAATPTYARAGLAAPAVLVLARLLQGLSVGGEYGASATYLSEMAGAARRGFWSSLQYVTLIAGQLLVAALLVVSGYTAINAVVKAELFPVEVRALGVGFPYAVAVSLFGGTAEYLALWARQAGRERWYFYYVAACVAGSLVVYIRLPAAARDAGRGGVRRRGGVVRRRAWGGAGVRKSERQDRRAFDGMTGISGM